MKIKYGYIFKNKSGKFISHMQIRSDRFYVGAFNTKEEAEIALAVAKGYWIIFSVQQELKCSFYNALRGVRFYVKQLDIKNTLEEEIIR